MFPELKCIRGRPAINLTIITEASIVLTSTGMKKLNRRFELITKPAHVIDRRQFLHSTFIATTLASTGQLPLLLSKADNDSGIDSLSEPYSTKPVRNYLKDFSLTEMPLRKYQEYRLIYNIISWNIDVKTNEITNSIIGKLTFKRNVINSRPVYEVNQMLYFGETRNSTKAYITCYVDEWNSLDNWKLSAFQIGSRGQSFRLTELTETGKCEKGRIQIDSNGFQYNFNPRNPVMAQWTIPDYLLRKAHPGLNATFDLLQDLTSFKKDQSLIYDTETLLDIKGEKTIKLSTYVLTGQGSIPTHYLSDSRGLVQLVTSGILSWALSDATAHLE